MYVHTVLHCTATTIFIRRCVSRLASRWQFLTVVPVRGGRQSFHLRVGISVGIVQAFHFVLETRVERPIRHIVMGELQSGVHLNVAPSMRRFLLSVLLRRNVLEFIDTEVNGLLSSDNGQGEGANAGHIHALPFDPVAIGAP